MVFCQISAQNGRTYLSRPFDAKVCYGITTIEFSRNGTVSWVEDGATHYTKTGKYKCLYDTKLEQHCFIITWSNGKVEKPCWAYYDNEKDAHMVYISGMWYAEDICR